MRRQFNSKVLQFGIALVIAAAPDIALAQQGQGGELPPPTLDAPAAVPAPESVPAVTVPAAPETSASPPPAAAQTRSAPMPESAEQPWYKRMWGSVTGWFAGEGDGGQQVAPAPAPQSAAPAPQPRASGAPVDGYAVDSPDRTIRTGVLGECVKTGTWRDGMQVMECEGAAGTEPMATPEPTAVAVQAPAPDPEPVEVQPLPTPAEEPQAALAAEPAPAPEPAPMPPVSMPETMTLSADALFAVNSDVLKPTAKESLDEMARKLGDMEYDSVKVVGHTDPTGSVALNDRLSKRRAEAVKRYLVEQGVAAEKISAQGVGSSMPVVDANSCAALPKGQRAACFQADRRVDIEVTGTVDPMAKQ